MYKRVFADHTLDSALQYISRVAIFLIVFFMPKNYVQRLLLRLSTLSFLRRYVFNPMMIRACYFNAYSRQEYCSYMAKSPRPPRSPPSPKTPIPLPIFQQLRLRTSLLIRGMYDQPLLKVRA